MNATEEYLDKLLRGVSGISETEEDTEPEEELSDDLSIESQIFQDEEMFKGEPVDDIVTETPVAASDEGNADGFSIIEEADALLSDLPLLDIPEDIYENDEEISIASGIPISIPVPADNDTAETIIEADEEIQLDETPADMLIQGEISDEEASTDKALFDEIMSDEAIVQFDKAYQEEIPAEEIPLEEVPIDEVPAEEIPVEEIQFDNVIDENPDVNIESSTEISDELPSLDEILEGVSSVDESIDTSIDNTGLEGMFGEETLEDEDIAALLQDIENMGREEALNDSQNEVSEVELEEMLSESEDADMSEIGDILIKDENNIPVDESLNENIDFTSGMLSEEELFDGMEDILLDEEDNKKDKKKKKKKRVRKTKENNDSEEIDEIKEKGKGFFARLLDILVASDDEEDEGDQSVKFEESAVDIAIEGAAENDSILAELEQAGDSKKKKKDKKKKDKKGKKASQSPDGDFDEEGEATSEKDKKKDEKEKKKAEKARLKAEQKEREALMPKKKLPKKKVIPICILCFSLGVVITLCAFLMPSALDKKKAKEQYFKRNYEETYSLLKGHSLSEKEQLLYDRTVTLLQEERKLDSYNNYMLLDMKPEALNALVQGVKKYDELSARAAELQVTDELDNIYNQIIYELNSSFNVSIDKARQWINVEDVEEYSYIINTYAKGEGSSVIEGMEEGYSDTAEGINNPVISAEEAEIQ